MFYGVEVFFFYSPSYPLTLLWAPFFMTLWFMGSINEQMVLLVSSITVNWSSPYQTLGSLSTADHSLWEELATLKIITIMDNVLSVEPSYLSSSWVKLARQLARSGFHSEITSIRLANFQQTAFPTALKIFIGFDNQSAPLYKEAKRCKWGWLVTKVRSDCSKFYTKNGTFRAKS